MANIDLTTNGWCELIFEGRNKEYGAYKLRQTTPRRNFISIITIAVFAAILILGFWVKTRYDEYQLAHSKNDSVTEISALNQPKKKEAKVERKVEVEEKKEVVKEVKSSIKFTAPVIRKDNLVKPEEEMKTQAEIMNNNTAIGALDVKGNSNNGEVLKVTQRVADEPVKPEIPSVSYHDYKMDYQPTVTKTVLNSDGENVNGKMIPKNDEHTYVLNNGNIFANAKVGDTVTTRDPLEFGEVPNIEANKAENEAKGWNVDYDEASKTYTFTAKYEGKTLEAPTIKFVASDDNGFYDNTYKSGRNGYETFSNTVTNKTPTAPKPHKSVTDSKGNDIDGKTTEDDKVTFHLTTDYSPYKDMAASKQALKFALLDDVQDGAFTVDEDAITIVDSKNNDVKELFDMYHVLSDEGRTDAINKILNESGLNPTGEFYLWVAKNPVDYYQDYILKNNNVTVNLPATLQVPAGTTVENDFYQIDFGNAYKSNLVSFDTPPAAPVGESGGPTSTPVTPVEEVPVQQQAIKVLPNTGEKSTSAIATAGAVILATALGMLGFSKRSKEY